MGSKERIQRSKENTRSSILKAALKIVKQRGWQALNMRKIAEDIEYTAPVIYEYFTSKESLVADLTNTGFIMLAARIKDAQKGEATPANQLTAMWLAYWNFAFAEKELYQAMFGVEVNCSNIEGSYSKAEEFTILFSNVIRSLMIEVKTEDSVRTKYFTLWSMVHGLVSINLVNKGTSDEINHRVLNEAIQSTILSLTN